MIGTLKLILLVPALALLALGTEGLYRALGARQPLTTTCSQFVNVNTRPSAPRLRITGCEIDPAGAAYREADGHITELFFPVRPAGAATVPAPLIVVSSEAAAVAVAQTVLGGGRTPAADQSVAVMQKVIVVLNVAKEIDGLARTGFLARMRSRRVLSGFATPIADEALVVDLRGEPDYVVPMLALGGGLLLAATAWLLSRPAKTTAATMTAAPLPDAVEADSNPLERPVDSRFESPVDSNIQDEYYRPAEPQPLPERVAARLTDHAPAVSLPALLLLNIEVESGPEAIETAPPLGSRGEVIAILQGVVPGLHLDASRNVMTRSDGSLTLNLGKHDPVPTVVVETRGIAGVALVSEVLLMTGWRAFAPKTGLFVGVDDLEALSALAGSGPESNESR